MPAWQVVLASALLALAILALFAFMVASMLRRRRDRAAARFRNDRVA